MSEPGEWDGGNGGPAPYIRMRNPTTDELRRLEGLANSAFNLQKNLMTSGFASTPVHIELTPQKHDPLIPAWFPCFILGCALIVAGISQMHQALVAGVLVVFALILMPASFEGIRAKREDKVTRFWREVGALEMDIYGEHVSSETMRRFGGGLSQ